VQAGAGEVATAVQVQREERGESAQRIGEGTVQARILKKRTFNSTNYTIFHTVIKIGANTIMCSFNSRSKFTS
jgi:hypothetical protein